MKQADKYSHVPWLDREGNLVWYEGQEKEVTEPSEEDFPHEALTQTLPKEAKTST